MMEVFILTIILLALALAGIGIKMLLKPGNTFTQTCGSSFDPDKKKHAKCKCRENNYKEDCENDDEKI